MAEVRERKFFGPSGLADVRVRKNGVQINFADGNVYDLPADEWDEERPQGKYRVSLSRDTDRILGVSPVAGQYIMEFSELGNKKDGLPNNKLQRGGPRQSRDGKKHWNQPDELVFTVRFKILEGISTNGIYGGLVIGQNFPYIFARPSSGNSLAFEGTKNGNLRIEKLILVSTGKTLSDVEIPYSDDPVDVLVRFEKFLTDSSRPFVASVSESGFVDVDSMVAVPSDLIPKKAKKATKKGKK